jgi:hypothetical protein
MHLGKTSFTIITTMLRSSSLILTPIGSAVTNEVTNERVQEAE